MRTIAWSGLAFALVSSLVHAQEGPQAPAASVARPFESALTTSAVTAAAADASASGQDPAAKQDSATLDFFRKIEISGFVDTYYAYNFNRPSQPCATVAGVTISNHLYNFT